MTEFNNNFQVVSHIMFDLPLYHQLKVSNFILVVNMDDLANHRR